MGHNRHRKRKGARFSLNFLVPRGPRRTSLLPASQGKGPIFHAGRQQEKAPKYDLPKFANTKGVAPRQADLVGPKNVIYPACSSEQRVLHVAKRSKDGGNVFLGFAKFTCFTRQFWNNRMQNNIYQFISGCYIDKGGLRKEEMR